MNDLFNQNNLDIKIEPKIEESWKEVLKDEFSKLYFVELKKFLIEEKKKYRIFPPGNLIFNAYNLTPFYKVKVVILGQDPYHGFGQAHGLCFSVPKGVPKPPSLINIFKELKDDLNIDPPNHGDLTQWALQGVFLINAILTVRENQASSHRNKGWENFTDATIKALSSKRENLVFLLWGKFAQEKKYLIDQHKHLVLEAAHPSPYSAAGFFGCRHFSKTNEYLVSKGISPINWKID